MKKLLGLLFLVFGLVQAGQDNGNEDLDIKNILEDLAKRKKKWKIQ